MILLDTNLLGRMANSMDAQCKLAQSAIHTLLRRDEKLIIFPQSLYEFWAIATRKPGASPVGQNGLGLDCEHSNLWLNFFKRRFMLLPDHPDLVITWQELVADFNIKGFKAHDARLVAAMQTHGITQLLTFNFKDFKHFSISIIDPASI